MLGLGLPAAAQSLDGLVEGAGASMGTALAVSGDGSVVAGYIFTSGALQEAAVWSYDGTSWSGATSLAHGAWSHFHSLVYGLSADGRVAAGMAYHNSGSDGRTAVWRYDGTSWGSAVELGTLGGVYGTGLGISGDGNVVTGWSSTPANEWRAAVWRYDGTVWSPAVDLGTLGGTHSHAFGASHDGSVVAGWAYIPSGQPRAAVWNYNGTVWSPAADLGTLGGAQSVASAVSADGSVIAGWADLSSNQPHAAAWRYDGTIWSPADLGTLGGAFSHAFAVSGDGGTIVGQSEIGAGGDSAFRWTEADGMESVQQLLIDAGVDMSGWWLQTARGVSDDGSVIVGSGQNPSGMPQAWIARFSSGGTGLITADEVARSFAGQGWLGHTGRAALGGTLSAMSQHATQGLAPCAASDAQCQRFSVFAQGGYDTDPIASGKLGVTARLGDGSMIAGALIGVDHIRTDLYAGGEATMTGGSAGLFLAQVPEAGLQWLVGLGGLTASGDIERAYYNGAAIDTSTGETDGYGYALEARLGWSFAGLLPATTLTPYASWTYSAMRYDGYTETGGAFPASFDAFTDSAHVARLGADMRYDLGAGKSVWGGLAWGHRLGGDGPGVSGTVTGLFGMSVPGVAGADDWLEASAGMRLAVAGDTAFTASVTATAARGQEATFLSRIGLSKSF